MLRPPALIAAGVLLLSASLGAQAPSVLSGDSRAVIKAAAAAFSASDLGPEQGSLVSTFPLRLMESLAPILNRRLGPQEIAAYREWARDKSLFAEGQTLSDSRFSADRARLLPGGASASDADKKAAVARERIDAIASLDPSYIPSASLRPISWKAGSREDGLMEPVGGDPLLACAKADLDILLYGAISGIDDYLAVDIVLYSRFLARPLFSWTTAFAEDDSGSALAEVEDGLRDALAGGPTGSLSIQVSPPDTDIYLDGAFVGRGDSVLSGMGTGTKKLEFQAEGRLPVTMEAEVAEDRVVSVQASLSRSMAGTVSVRSLPEGATLYLDALRLGTSPQEIEATGKSHVISARAGGGAEAVAVGPLDPGADFLLEPAVKSPAEGFAARRDDFYSSLGWFMASLPVSVLSTGLLSIAEREYASGGDPGNRVAWWTGAGATVGLSASLLGVTLWKFFRYIQSADRR